MVCEQVGGIPNSLVSEVNSEGQVLRQFSGSPLISVRYPAHVAIDPQRGNIFVSDFDRRRILLLDSHLTLCRVIVDETQLRYDQDPLKLCFVEQTGQLLVAFSEGAALYDVLGR